uniref:Uncharacterized protein n=1 Tax=Anguilla anguilla TaxID=7936 RepID=A0A0E9QR57_ANGAN
MQVSSETLPSSTGETQQPPCPLP